MTVHNINISNDEFDKEKINMCFNDFEAKKLLVDTEIRSLDDVTLFLHKYFRPTTGENYLFMKLIKMLIDKNNTLNEEIEKLKNSKKD